MNGTLRTWWARGLTATLAVLYGWIGLAGHGLDRLLGIAGALLILTALVLARETSGAPILEIAGPTFQERLDSTY